MLGEGLSPAEALTFQRQREGNGGQEQRSGGKQGMRSCQMPAVPSPLHLMLGVLVTLLCSVPPHTSFYFTCHIKSYSIFGFE